MIISALLNQPLDLVRLEEALLHYLRELIPAYAYQPPVSTGTFAPAYSITGDPHPRDRYKIDQFPTITAMPAYRGRSLEVGRRGLILYLHSVCHC